MAKVHTEVVVIKMSKLVKDNDKDVEFLTQEVKNNLEVIVQELVGDGILIEVEDGQ